MITRLQITGFKNLLNVDIRFGPFTCIAGLNGFGKSNLFDAIQFLSLLAQKPLLEAARAVRGGGRIRDLFHRTGDQRLSTMHFAVEMIIPSEGKDDLGQSARASSTLLEYRLTLTHSPDSHLDTIDRLAILEESLGYITKGEAHRHLHFPHTARTWRDSVVFNRKRGEAFISTEEEEGNTIVRLHQDGGGSRGRPLSFLARSLPRTVLSSTNAAESPTALLARREMESWRLLQMEPSALRRSDTFTDPHHLGSDGSHLAATLYRLEHQAEVGTTSSNSEHSPSINRQEPTSGHIYAEVGNRLATFLDDVRKVSVERDEKRELLTLQVKTKSGTNFPAPALSDGSLRFLALAILEIDPGTSGVICLEEPENGIHPNRIAAMINLLRRIAVDPDEVVGDDNPLRQVIVNTHSPAVVQQVPEESLLVAYSSQHLVDNQRLEGVEFRPLAQTWRTDNDENATQPVVASLGDLLSYLNPAPKVDDLRPAQGKYFKRRVVDRDDVQRYLPFAS